MPILLKVGRANACNIRFNSPNVSSLHAEIIVADDGKIYINDTNSTNGTYVGNERLQPGQEREVRRGDLIRFADSTLNWAQVPHPESGANLLQVVNIGSDYRNNMVIDDPFVSRFHAKIKVGKNKKATIRDLSSSNGTIVNGMKIAPNRDVPIKRGDSVLLGNKDISAELANILPNPTPVGKIIAITCGAVAAVAAIIVAVFMFFPGFMNKSQPWAPQDARQAVVYVTATYIQSAKLDDCPINADIWTSVMSKYFSGVTVEVGEIPTEAVPYNATAFFIDREGRMGTNRHVAMPWDTQYQDNKEIQAQKAQMEQFVDRYLPNEVSSMDDVEAINSLVGEDSRFAIWNMIYTQTVREYKDGKISNPLSYINSMIRQLRKSKISTVGRLVEIKVGYPGRNYTHTDEYDRCVPTTVSDTPDIDLAILQLNTKKTPADIVRVFDPVDYYKGDVKPLETKLVWIGYPRGNNWNMDEKTHSLEPQIRETQIAKVPSKYNYEVQGEVVGGASGSPVYDPATGRLYGVLWGYNAGGATYGQACQAKYLYKLYKEDLGEVTGEE